MNNTPQASGQPQTATVNLQNITWQIKEITVDSSAAVSEELTYQTKTDMQIRNDLTGIALDLQIVVTDAKGEHGKPLAHLTLGLTAGITGLEVFVNGNTANIPNEFAHQLVIMMSHTARGILMHAGRGTSLEKFPLPLFGAEQIGQAAVTPQQRPN
jgi:hypothetical protein